jgi:hypothetical protein
MTRFSLKSCVYLMKARILEKAMVMESFKGEKEVTKNSTKRETEHLQAGDFWLLLFVSVVILLFVFRFSA